MKQTFRLSERGIELLQRLAWYYEVNDCRDRSKGDAIEVPISDLLEAKKEIKAMGWKAHP